MEHALQNGAIKVHVRKLFLHVPLSFMHQVKGLVDVNQRHGVSGKLIHLDLAYQVVLH